MLDANNFVLLIVLLFIIMAVTITFAIMVIVLYKKLIKSSTNQNTNNNSDHTVDNEFIKQVLNMVSDQNSNNTKEKVTTEKNLMNIFVKLRNSIRENCVTAMTSIGAARIAIYLFHNGTRSSHGVSFFKMSCICEKVAVGSGVRERMMEHTNIPINLFDEMIEKLINYDRYIIINDENAQESNHKIFISADKISYVQLVTIYDINNNMLGFVSAEMDKDYSKDDVDAEKKVLDELVKQLVPVLSYSDYISMKTS